MTIPNNQNSQQLALIPADFDGDYFAYHNNFISESEVARLTAILWAELDWSQYNITLFGRSVAQPRLSAWYGDPEASYRYSGLRLKPLSWHRELLSLKNRLEKYLRHPFNSVLANAYRDGNDSMGWHSDNEVELGEEPVVASVSLGAARRFLVRRKNRTHSAGFWLEPGSLLLMKRGCQQVYQHSLPKTRRICGLRINLTFRQIVNQLPP